MLDVCQRVIAASEQDLEFIRIDKAIFETCPDDSIDYALMEPLCNQGNNDVMVVCRLD
jgi:mannose-1-phosphate guanylyltransferase